MKNMKRSKHSLLSRIAAMVLAVLFVLTSLPSMVFATESGASSAAAPVEENSVNSAEVPSSTDGNVDGGSSVDEAAVTSSIENGSSESNSSTAEQAGTEGNAADAATAAEPKATTYKLTYDAGVLADKYLAYTTESAKINTYKSAHFAEWQGKEITTSTGTKTVTEIADVPVFMLPADVNNVSTDASVTAEVTGADLSYPGYTFLGWTELKDDKNSTTDEYDQLIEKLTNDVTDAEAEAAKKAGKTVVKTKAEAKDGDVVDSLTDAERQEIINDLYRFNEKDDQGKKKTSYKDTYKIDSTSTAKNVTVGADGIVTATLTAVVIPATADASETKAETANSSSAAEESGKSSSSAAVISSAAEPESKTTSSTADSSSNTAAESTTESAAASTSSVVVDESGIGAAESTEEEKSSKHTFKLIYSAGTLASSFVSMPKVVEKKSEDESVEFDVQEDLSYNGYTFLGWTDKTGDDLTALLSSVDGASTDDEIKTIQDGLYKYNERYFFGLFKKTDYEDKVELTTDAEESDYAIVDADGNVSAALTAVWKKDAVSGPAIEETLTPDDATITVSADENTFPDGTTVSAVKISDDSAITTDDVATAIADKDAEILSAYDITFKDADGNVVEPDDGKSVSVEITLNDRVELDENEKLVVYHLPLTSDRKSIDTENITEIGAEEISAESTASAESSDESAEEISDESVAESAEDNTAAAKKNAAWNWDDEDDASEDIGSGEDPENAGTAAKETRRTVTGLKFSLDQFSITVIAKTTDSSSGTRTIYVSNRNLSTIGWNSDAVWLHAWDDSGSADYLLTDTGKTDNSGNKILSNSTVSASYNKFILVNASSTTSFDWQDKDKGKRTVNFTFNFESGSGQSYRDEDKDGGSSQWDTLTGTNGSDKINIFFVQNYHWSNGPRYGVGVETQDALKSLTLSPSEITVVKGSSTDLSLVATGLGENPSITVTSSNESVATVSRSADGVVTVNAVSASDDAVTITATSATDNTLTATAKIHVIESGYHEGYIYFDATLSKLSYKGSADNGYGGGGMPYSSDQSGATGLDNSWIGNIYVAFSKDSNGSNHTNLAAMAQPITLSSGGHTYSNVYSYQIPADYTYVRFYSKNTGVDSISDTDWYGGATAWMQIDASNPCFYADTSDQTIYDGGLRGGYWAMPYTVRNPETENSSKKTSNHTATQKTSSGDTTVSDGAKSLTTITSDTFTKAANTLYVDSSFYDYYSDYELNGTNLAYYNTNEDESGSQRSYVRFRQFNQALSDYYGSSGTKLYEGHFQPSVDGWGNQFNSIAGTLGLNGYSNTVGFFSSNNSVVGNTGTLTNQERYADAAWGLVSKSLSGYSGKGTGTLMTSDGSVALPFFNTSFLKGGNSKNAVIGKTYSDVKFPFTKTVDDGVDYWQFDSAKTTLHMAQDSGTKQYYLKDVSERDSNNALINNQWSMNVDSQGKGEGDGVSNDYGFFPLNDTTITRGSKRYNYGFGTRLDFTFRLTDDGTVEDTSGNTKPITFQFSGDDDVWVFLDGKLVLDIGGDHGRTSGVINFAHDTKQTSYTINESTYYDKKTHNITGKVPASSIWVSGVKPSVNDNSDYPTHTEDTINSGTTKTLSDLGFSDLGTGKHVITMFYMERGMWESNMKVRFNWPDENELDVSKKVDTSDVNSAILTEEVKEIFENAQFTFGLENLATHYGAKDNGYTSVDDKTFTASSVYPNNSNVVFQTTNEQNAQYLWSAHGNGDGVTWTNQLGVLESTSGFNADENGERRTLTFEYYYQHIYSGYPLRDTDLYLELEDSSGKTLSGTMNSIGTLSTTSRNTWGTATVDLKKMNGASDFKFEAIRKIKFGYQWYQNLCFYLRNFTFKGTGTSPGTSVSVFGVQQKDIADYGSATSGKLEQANGAEYTKSKAGTADTTSSGVVANGEFSLSNGYEATFTNQFRRGSYISLYEKNVDTNLYTVTWELGDETNSKAHTGSGVAVDDGRTELTTQKADINEQDSDNNNNKYWTDNSATTAHGSKPSGSTIVFRNFTSPDENTDAVKVTAAFTNKVNVGSITIQKKKSDNGADLEKSYHFVVRITSIAGQTLNTAIEFAYDLTAGQTATITGIPINATYTITETNNNNEENVSLEGVTKDNAAFSFTGDATNGYVVTDSLEKKTGTTSYNYTFSNLKAPKVSIQITKYWKAANGSDYSGTLPDHIWVQLQRKASEDLTWEAVALSGLTISGKSSEISVNYPSCYKLQKNDSGNWTATIQGLQQYKNNDTSKTYSYRFVEVAQDEYGEIVADQNGNPSVISDDGNGTVTFSGVTFTVGAPSPSTIDNTSGTIATLTNTEKPAYSFKVTKESSSEMSGNVKKRLAGVKFKLYSDEVCSNVIKFTQSGSAYTKATDGTVEAITTSDNGEFTVSNLESGTYYLKETQGLDGYNAFTGVITITLNGTTQAATLSGGSASTGEVKDSSWDSTTTTLSFTVTNVPGVELPSAGGRGITLFLELGAALIAVAAGLLVLKRRKLF